MKLFNKSCKWKKVWLFAALAVLFLSLTGCGQTRTVDLQNLNQPTVKIGAEIGTMMEENVLLCYPDAQIVYTTSFADGLQQLEAGQIDALVEDLSTAAVSLKKEDLPVKIVEGVTYPVDAQVIAAVSRYSEIPDAKNLVNEFLQEMQENGTLDEMEKRWTEDLDYTMPEIPKAENPTGTVRIATTGLAEPFTFYQNGELCGYDIELAERFAYWAGLDYEFKIYDWNGIYSAVAIGAADYAFSNLYLTEDAENSVDISEPYMVSTCCLMIRSQDSSSFLEDFAEKFYNNFIEEDRWLTLVKGLKNTLIITILTAIFGFLLGFLLAVGKCSKIPPLRRFLNGLTYVVKSEPILVLLLLFYYVIFKDLQTLTVAVIAFTVNFGAFISDTMVSCIQGVDRGQWEVAQTLGFTKRKTLFRIILPQVAESFLPAYLSAVISMMLLTSVVGYISLIDLTFAAQMIRARTFDAIYTLVASGIIYFLIAALLNLLLRLLVKKCFKQRKPLKGLQIEGNRKQAPVTKRMRKEKTDETVIEVRGLTKAYPEAVPLNHLDCCVKKGEVITIIGPSGTGKSTLIRCIERLENPTEGSIRLFGTEVSCGKRKELQSVYARTGMVFQNFCLFEHLTVVENVMISQALVQNKSRQEAYDASVRILAALGLTGKELQYPRQLSGGQRQRVAIARALAMDPEILFFDEPTSALDPSLVGEVICTLKKLADSGMTMVIVTHDMRLARMVSDRVFFLDQGRVWEEGTPGQIFDAPQTDSCRFFVRKLKTLHLEATHLQVDLPGMVGSIDDFSEKYYVPWACRSKLYQLAEELMIAVILNMGYEKARLDAEYDQEQEICEAEITYAGEPCNVLETETEEYRLSLALVTNRLTEAEYHYEDGINRIRLKF